MHRKTFRWKMRARKSVRRLDRSNAFSKMDYAAELSSWPTSDSDSSGTSSWWTPTPRAGSLDLPPPQPYHAGKASFRINGEDDGVLTLLCESFGLSGPEDFGISIKDWEDRKARCFSAEASALVLVSEPGTALVVSDDDDGLIHEEPDDTYMRLMMLDIGNGTPPIISPPPPLPAAASAYDTDESSVSLQHEGERSDECGDGWLGGTAGGDGHDSSAATTSTTEETRHVTSATTANGFRVKRDIKGWTKGRELGRGSFGTVFEAMNGDGFFFAVKEVSLLDPGSCVWWSVEQLQQEINLLSHFEHENIVQYLGTQKVEGKLFIFLELVTKGSLASLYHEYCLHDSQVSAYTRQILNGLKYLHDQNIVHRDIKCANILVDANGLVKLADFGLAKQMDEAEMLKSCKGSVYWMAPEVINPKRKYGPAADIWSLGCTVLEMLTRKPPYNLELAQAVFLIGRGKTPDIPDSLSSDARNFIRLCVQSNPEDRPTASELLEHPFVKRLSPPSASFLSLFGR